MSFLTLAILSAIFLKGSLVIFYVLPFYIVGYVLWMKKKIKGLPISPDKLTFADTTTNSARSLDLVTLWLLEICAFLFVLLGIFVLLTSPITFPKKWFIGLSCILFFGWGMYVFGKVIMAKKGRNHNESFHADRFAACELRVLLLLSPHLNFLFPFPSFLL